MFLKSNLFILGPRACDHRAFLFLVINDCPYGAYLGGLTGVLGPQKFGLQ